MSESLAVRLARLPHDRREQILNTLSPFEQSLLLYTWGFMGRPEQQIAVDDPAQVHLVLAGRAFGKTKLGGNWARAKAESGRAMVGALIGPDEGEIRKYMVEGPSGIRKSCPPWFQPEWYSSRGQMKLVWPNGAIAECHSAEESQYRGPNLDWVWWDEPAKCRWLAVLYDNVVFALRNSSFGMLPPQILFTGTPLPIKFLRDLKAQPTTRYVGGSSLDNSANLPREYVDKLKSMGDTRLARQERGGELLDDEQGSLFKSAIIDAYRIESPADLPRRFLRGLVIADPADSTTDRSDATGLVVMAVDAQNHLYIFNGKAERWPAEEWAKIVFDWREKWRSMCDKFEIAAEKNKGGELVRTTLRLYEENAWLKAGKEPSKFRPTDVHLVWSSVSKADRAKPVAQLYEVGRVHHVGNLWQLEQEMRGWIPGVTKKSPNGLDALAIGAHVLLDLSEPMAIDEGALLAGVGRAMRQPEDGIRDAIAELERDFLGEDRGGMAREL